MILIAFQLGHTAGSSAAAAVNGPYSIAEVVTFVAGPHDAVGYLAGPAEAVGYMAGPQELVDT